MSTKAENEVVLSREAKSYLALYYACIVYMLKKVSPRLDISDLKKITGRLAYEFNTSDRKISEYILRGPGECNAVVHLAKVYSLTTRFENQGGHNFEAISSFISLRLLDLKRLKRNLKVDKLSCSYGKAFGVVLISEIKEILHFLSEDAAKFWEVKIYENITPNNSGCKSDLGADERIEHEPMEKPKKRDSWDYAKSDAPVSQPKLIEVLKPIEEVKVKAEATKAEIENMLRAVHKRAKELSPDEGIFDFGVMLFQCWMHTDSGIANPERFLAALLSGALDLHQTREKFLNSYNAS